MNTISSSHMFGLVLLGACLICHDAVAQVNVTPSPEARSAILAQRRAVLRKNAEEITDTAKFRRENVVCSNALECVIADGRARFFIAEPVVEKNGDISVTTVFYGNDRRDDGKGMVMLRETEWHVFRKAGATWVQLPYAGPLNGH